MLLSLKALLKHLCLSYSVFYIYENFSIAEEVWCRFADSHFSLIPLHFSTSTVSPNSPATQ